MNCNQIRDLLTSYLLNDLDVETKSLVDKHFATCEKCRAELIAVTPTVSMLSDVLRDNPNAPRKLRPEQHARIQNAMKPRLQRFAEQSRKPQFSILWLAATVLIGFMLVGTLLPALSRSRGLARCVSDHADK